MRDASPSTYVVFISANEDAAAAIPECCDISRSLPNVTCGRPCCMSCGIRAHRIRSDKRAAHNSGGVADSADVRDIERRREPGSSRSTAIEAKPSTNTGRRQPSIRRAATLTALAGISHAVLFLIAFGLLSTVPGQNATDAEMLAYYDSPESRRVLVIGLLHHALRGHRVPVVHRRSSPVDRAVVTSTRRDELSRRRSSWSAGFSICGLFLVSAAAISSTAATVPFSDAPMTASRSAHPAFIRRDLVDRAGDAHGRGLCYLVHAGCLSNQLHAALDDHRRLHRRHFPALEHHALAASDHRLPDLDDRLCLLLLQRARQIPRNLRMPANPISRPDRQ